MTISVIFRAVAVLMLLASAFNLMTDFTVKGQGIDVYALGVNLLVFCAGLGIAMKNKYSVYLAPVVVFVAGSKILLEKGQYVDSFSAIMLVIYFFVFVLSIRLCLIESRKGSA